MSTAEFDFGAVWQDIPMGAVEWRVGAQGDDSRAATFHFHRVPDFDGRAEPALDWISAAERNLDWLLSLPRDPITCEPRWLIHSWHGDPATPVVAYPALHYPSFVALFLIALERTADDARRAALTAALEAVASAIMAWRTPDSGVAPRMPITTRLTRADTAQAEERTITVFRAARAGEALLRLHAWRAGEGFLEYAVHIGDALTRLQRADGSWPYRIRPDTGEVVEDYSSGAACTVPFLRALSGATGQDRYSRVADRAWRWTLENPCVTMRWQGMYEDVGAFEPYGNLENWDAIDTICLLCRERTPGSLDAAKALNRWVEDQFVVFGPADYPSCAHVHPPAVLEQYHCYYPMEAHTARWMVALRELWQATGDETCLLKASRAANAIVRGQSREGRFSTWGVDARTGLPLFPAGDWYGSNAIAAAELMIMARSGDAPPLREAI